MSASEWKQIGAIVLSDDGSSPAAEAVPNSHEVRVGLRWAELLAHFDEWSEEGQDGRVFVGPQGATPKRLNFQVTWSKAVEKAGVPGLHFHDLRHTGKTLAAGGTDHRFGAAPRARRRRRALARELPVIRQHLGGR